MTIGYFGARRGAGALALALAVTAANGALASASTTTLAQTVVVSPNGQVAFGSEGHPGVHGGSSSEAFAQAAGNATQFGNASSDALRRDLLSTDARGNLTIDHTRGLTTLHSVSAASLADTITVLGGAAGDHGDVILHKTLTLRTEDITGISANIFQDGRYDATADAEFRFSASDLNGSLIGPAPSGADIFGSSTFSDDGRTERRGFLGAPQTLDFTMRLHLGEARAFDIFMLDTFDMAFDNIDGDRRAFFSGASTHGLNFADGISITDVAGNAICGLRVQSELGLSFGSTDDCPTGGGGGTGGNGGGGAVPEPAAWALMIAGFGMAGAMLRTRRRALAA